MTEQQTAERVSGLLAARLWDHREYGSYSVPGSPFDFIVTHYETGASFGVNVRELTPSEVEAKIV